MGLLTAISGSPTTYSMWRALRILQRRLTDTGVVLFLFVPGVRVVQHRAERENERFCYEASPYRS